jgi:choline dehydrogenase-like flavoprotein
MTGFDHDVIVIGSGFDGSVSALRLAETGYSVAVLEAGLGSETTTSPRPRSMSGVSSSAPSSAATASSGSTC